ncbi:hypothetical protein J6590_102497, partial [Homalodisca vitripennis]
KELDERKLRQAEHLVSSGERLSKEFELTSCLMVLERFFYVSVLNIYQTAFFHRKVIV